LNRRAQVLTEDFKALLLELTAAAQSSEKVLGVDGDAPVAAGKVPLRSAR
jgi:hypothetical protein